MLCLKKTDGAVAALLDVLPNIEDEDVAEEVARQLLPLAKDKAGKLRAAAAGGADGSECDEASCGRGNGREDGWGR